MNKLKDIVKKIKSGWNNLDKNKKRILLFSVIALLLFITIYTYFITRVTYTTLFTNLELTDAANITADLDTKKIKYKIENGGKDIYIDSKYVDRERLDLAKSGLMPQSSTGFEIFDDNSNMMLTDKDRDIMYQRALAGELQRSIMSLDEVQNAKVNLVMSKDSVFNSEKSQASASVIVSTKPGKKLNEDSIKGIVALVSGAVENLPEANVRLIDSSGNILNSRISVDETDTGSGSYSQQSENRNKFQTEIENNILNLLGPVYGPDKIKVAVYADLDFDAQQQTVITYKDPVVRSEQKSASGPGVDSNKVSSDTTTDSTQNVLSGSGTNGLESYDGTVNYELSQSTTTTVRAPGKVNKITTSVIYDGNLADDQKLMISNLVKSATGYNADRGDMIDVEGIIFDNVYQDNLDNSQGASTFLGKYLKYIIIGLSVLAGLIMLFVVRAILKKKKTDEDYDFESNIADFSEEKVDIVDEVFRKKLETKYEPKEAQLKEYVQGQPEIASELIKAWIKTEGD